MDDDIFDRGLQHDLRALANFARRRQVLRWAAGAGALALLGCNGSTDNDGSGGGGGSGGDGGSGAGGNGTCSPRRPFM